MLRQISVARSRAWGRLEINLISGRSSLAGTPVKYPFVTPVVSQRWHRVAIQSNLMAPHSGVALIFESTTLHEQPLRLSIVVETACSLGELVTLPNSKIIILPIKKPHYYYFLNNKLIEAVFSILYVSLIRGLYIYIFETSTATSTYIVLYSGMEITVEKNIHIYVR